MLRRQCYDNVTTMFRPPPPPLPSPNMTLCVIGRVGFERNCDEMYSRHQQST